MLLSITPKPVRHPAYTAVILLILLLSTFILLTLIQPWLSLSTQPHWLFTLFCSVICIQGFYRFDTGLYLPWRIQQYLVNKNLAQDINDRSVQTVHATIIAYRERKIMGLPHQVQLCLQAEQQQTADWFQFNIPLQKQILLSEQLIGQQVHVCYLARSKTILEIFDLNPFIAIDSLPESHQGKNILTYRNIPSRFIQDIMRPSLSVHSNIRSIHVTRVLGESVHTLQITMRYGQVYQFESTQTHFPSLIQFLSQFFIDSFAYHRFKQDPRMLECDIFNHTHFSIRKIGIYSIASILAIVITIGLFHDFMWSSLILLVLILAIYTLISKDDESPFLTDHLF